MPLNAGTESGYTYLMLASLFVIARRSFSEAPSWTGGISGHSSGCSLSSERQQRYVDLTHFFFGCFG